VLLGDFHPNIRIRVFSAFLTRLVTQMIFPFMGIYLADHFGRHLAGVLLTITVVISLVSSLYGGYISDRIGRKKVMVASEVIQFTAYLVIALTNSPLFTSAWITYLMMILQSIGSGLMLPASEAMLIDVSTKENRKFLYSINYWSVNLSTAIGAIVGGLFFKSYLFELFCTMTLVSAITLSLVLFFLQESHTTKTNRKKSLIENYKIVAKDRVFILFCTASFLVLSLEFQTTNYIAIRLKDEFVEQTFHFYNLFSLHIDGILVSSWIRTENTVLAIFGMLWLVRWLKKLPNNLSLFAGIALYIIGYTFLGFVNNLTIITSAVVLLTLGELLYIPVKQSVLADIVKDDVRSSYMAINGMIFQGARIVGAFGITIGAILPSWFMAILFLTIGLLGMSIFRIVWNSINAKDQQESQKQYINIS